MESIKFNRKPYKRPEKEMESKIRKYRLSYNLTIKDLAKKARTHISVISSLQNGTLSPLYENGEIRPYVLRIIKVLNSDLETLFPRYFCKIKHPKPILNTQISDILISDYHKSPLNLLEEKIKNKIFEKVLTSISSRERNILEARFGWYSEPKTLKEVGEIFLVTGARIREIEARALRKLRHPTRSNLLKEYL